MLEKYTFQSFYGNISITMELKLRRKIETVLEKYYETDQGKILLVDGARQTGKSYIIRETAKKAFKNYIEINLFEDKHGSQLFSTVDTVEKFNLTVSLFTGPGSASFIVAYFTPTLSNILYAAVSLLLKSP